MTEEFIDLNVESTDVETTEMEIEIEETIGWVVDTEVARHIDLPDRNTPDQHIISSISGLQEKLDEIESLKTVCSNKHGVANYYEWESGAYDDVGYFVSLVPQTSRIKICDGSDIFGVTIKKEDVGFVGNDDAAPRGNNYGLVVTSGLVDVRCASGIEPGNYVVARKDGLAVKTDSDCGYKVIAKGTMTDGTECVSIVLGVQACTTDLLGHRVGRLEEDLEGVEIDIQTAIRLANEATRMAGQSDIKSDETQEKIDGVIDTTNGMREDVDNTLKDLNDVAEFVQDAAYQAGAVAKQAYDVANDAMAKADAVEGYSQYNLSLIKESSNQYERLIGSVDKYSIGEYSQSYGLTFEQAQTIIKKDMVYIPIESTDEIYQCTIGDKNYNFKQEFHKTSYYVWSECTVSVQTNEGTQDVDGYWWVGYHSKVEHSPIMAFRKSVDFWYDNYTLYKFEATDWAKFDKPIWVEAEAPTDKKYNYWFKDNVVKQRSIDLIDGTEKWEAYDTYVGKTRPTENGYDFWCDDTNFYTHWFEVNTIAGNVNNRLSSLIRQDVNSITTEIVNTCGSMTGFGMWIDDTKTATQQLSTWKTSEEEKKAVVRTEATEDGAEVIIAALIEDENGDLLEGAGLRLKAERDDEGKLKSDLKIEADSIQFTAEDYKIMADNIALKGLVTMTDLENAGATTINGANIKTGAIQSANYAESEGAEGMKLNLTTGEWDSPNFKVASDGSITATGVDIDGTINARNGKIGQFTITDGYMDMMVSGPKNLVMDADTTKTLSCYIEEYVEYHIDPSSNNGSVVLDNCGYLVPGETYTISIDLKLNAQRVEASANDGVKITVYGNDQRTCTTLAEVPIQTVNQRHKITELFNVNIKSDSPYITTMNQNYADYAPVRLRPRRATGNNDSIEIYEVKIVKGDHLKDIDVSGLVTSDFIGDAMSWSLTPDKCVWWNSLTSKESPLMRLDNTGLYVKGEIEAEKGYVGGWSIDTDILKSVNGRAYLYSGNGDTMTSVASTGVSPIRFCAGAGNSKRTVAVKHTFPSGGAISYTYQPTNCKEITSLTTPVLSEGQGGVSIFEGGVGYSYVTYTGNVMAGTTITFTCTYVTHVPTFVVLDDGSLYASAAEISGKINVAEGWIGGWRIGADILSSDNEDAYLYSGNDKKMASLVSSNTSPVRLAVGCDELESPNFCVLADGSVYASALEVGNGSALSLKTDDVSHNGYHHYLNFRSDYGYLEMKSDCPLTQTHQTTSNTTTYAAMRQFSQGLIFGYTLDPGNSSKQTVTTKHAIINKGDYMSQGGTWTEEDIISSLSDASRKHDIELLDDRYDVFFDNLTSRRFKYNHGTSDRYHTGYITNEVQTALRVAAVDEREFAAICTFDKGTEDEVSALRYSEFISLNTWQIQKLKSRVSELEEKLKELAEKNN